MYILYPNYSTAFGYCDTCWYYIFISSPPLVEESVDIFKWLKQGLGYLED